MTSFEMATDLSGSIRIPAHFCGLFGLKPTEHRVSLHGVVPDPYDTPRSVRIMSTVGPMARSAEDLALLYAIIAGPDGVDTDVSPVPVEVPSESILKNLRVAVAPTFPRVPAAADIRDAVNERAQRLERLGANVEEATLPELDFDEELSRAGEMIGTIAGAFQPDDNGSSTTLIQYLEALHRRDQSIVAWERFFDRWDVLLCPPSMTSAFPHCDAGSPLEVDGRREDYWMVSAHSTVFNYSGHPAIVAPYTVDRDGLPIGVQLVGKRWDESRLLAIAIALTDVTGGFRRPPGY